MPPGPFLYLLKGQVYTHEKQGIDIDAQRRWVIIFKICNLPFSGKCHNYEMNRQLIGKTEKEITWCWTVSLRKGWLGMPGLMGKSTQRQRLTGAHAPAGGIYPSYLSTIFFFSIKTKGTVSKLCLSHPQSSQSGPHWNQAIIFRNELEKIWGRSLFCGVTPLNGFFSEIWGPKESS